MRFLVTGAAGFIGKHLVKALIDHGHTVTGIDRAHDAPNYPYQRSDITNHGVMMLAVEDYDPDVIIHLAAQVGREFGEDDIWRTINWNAVGCATVAHAARFHRKRVLYTSTSEVYGDRGASLCTEFDMLNNLPHNLYGVTKRWGEDVLNLYVRPELLTTVRLSMPYGPGAPPGRGRRAMDNFLWQANHNMPVTVHKGAERSWCHIDDTIAAICLLLEQRRDGVWNVGRDDDPRPLLDVAKMACDIAGASHDLIEEIDVPPAQTAVKRLDTNKIRSIGWKPKVDLEDGMRDLFEWIKQFDAKGEWTGQPAEVQPQ